MCTGAMEEIIDAAPRKPIDEKANHNQPENLYESLKLLDGQFKVSKEHFVSELVCSEFGESAPNHTSWKLMLALNAQLLTTSTYSFFISFAGCCSIVNRFDLIKDRREFTLDFSYTRAHPT